MAKRRRRKSGDGGGEGEGDGGGGGGGGDGGGPDGGDSGGMGDGGWVLEDEDRELGTTPNYRLNPNYYGSLRSRPVGHASICGTIMGIIYLILIFGGPIAVTYLVFFQKSGSTDDSDEATTYDSMIVSTFESESISISNTLKDAFRNSTEMETSTENFASTTDINSTSKWVTYDAPADGNVNGTTYQRSSEAISLSNSTKIETSTNPESFVSTTDIYSSSTLITDNSPADIKVNGNTYQAPSERVPLFNSTGS
ncbi:hypothetical protein SNEBB_001922 [Seison nebaliae]|nr:hypothetical protein SNEBB_001922 [Seison nebaliae]